MAESPLGPRARIWTSDVQPAWRGDGVGGGQGASALKPAPRPSTAQSLLPHVVMGISTPPPGTVPGKEDTPFPNRGVNA